MCARALGGRRGGVSPLFHCCALDQCRAPLQQRSDGGRERHGANAQAHTPIWREGNRYTECGIEGCADADLQQQLLLLLLRRLLLLVVVVVVGLR